ncbi:protein FAM178B [Dryobates pubescens]|uniref:protein FAM178B n=1 Tax=Dryobates pubescens TaxID=118200 RepID=UPI0023B95CBF|nr:protein FAM178B [Dryobates pubescens]
MAPYRARLRWFQMPLSSACVPRSGLFSYKFQDSLQRYRRLRAAKRLRVGCAIAPPPPSLLQPPGPSPPASPPRASRRPRGAAWVQAPRRPRVCLGSRKWRSRRQQPAGTARPRAKGQDVPSRRPRPRQAALGGARHIPVVAAGSSRGGTDRERSSTAGTVPQQAGRSHRGHQAVCPQQEPLVNSLDSLLWEKRDFLAHFSTHSSSMPTLHPGEPIFCAQPVPVPTLDARRLQPQSPLERLFLWSSPSCQAALVHAGGLRLLYHSVPTCPVPVLRWLFQLLTLCPPLPNALQALCDLWLGTEGEQPWCPTLQEITQAVSQLGANLSPLLHRHLLPPELCPASTRDLDPSCSPRQADANSSLALVAQLGDVCQFLALCVVTQPCSYSDGARLALLTLFSFLGLARALRCQPLPQLQHLLHCLLEGIRDWQEQLPALCQALCQLSRHHHNLVALVQLLPDLTSRGRELRQLLSLHAVAGLLGEPPGSVPPPGAGAEVGAAGCSCCAGSWPWRSRMPCGAWSRPRTPSWRWVPPLPPTLWAPSSVPAALRASPCARCCPQVCYLSRSLLLLASAVVGTECPAAEQRGALQQLCARLERHFRSGRRRGTQLCGAQLESLVTLLLVRWQEMLA